MIMYILYYVAMWHCTNFLISNFLHTVLCIVLSGTASISVDTYELSASLYSNHT